MSTVEDTQPLFSHLIELRNRLLRSILSVIVVFLGLVWFANDIYAFMSAPLVGNKSTRKDDLSGPSPNRSRLAPLPL